jgi:hypothetical protein
MSFFKNSYYILDLDSNSNDKEVLKKTKNLLLKIKAEIDIEEEITQKLKLDIIRNEENINEASKHLSFPKKKLEEYFFWFEVEDEEDKRFIKLLSQEDFSSAIKFIEKNLNKDTLKSYKYEKNQCLAFLYILSKEYDEDFLIESFSKWEKLINNNKFWAHFFENFKNKEEGLVNKEILLEFKEEIESYILEEYEYLSKTHHKEKILEKLIKNFDFKNKEIKLKFIETYISKINSTLSKLESMEFENNKLSEVRKQKITDYLEVFKDTFKYFETLEINELPEIQVLSDEIAQTLEKVSIKINNTTKDYETSYKLIKIALKFANSMVVKDSVEKNFLIISQNREQIALDLILNLIKESKFASARSSIDHLLTDKKISKETKEMLKDIKQKITIDKDLDKSILKETPFLFDILGFGLMQYGETRFITAFFFPICPISRYNILNNPDGSTVYLGKKDLGLFYEIWATIFIIIVLAMYF